MFDFLFDMYGIIAFVLGVLTAQLAKPIFLLISKRKWDPSFAAESGGFPSSHTAGIVSLTTTIGLFEGFDDPFFAISFALSSIVAYDSANVRYYAGQHIAMTQQLLKDFQELTETKLNDPIYLSKLKNVLGHKWIEVFGGFIHGIFTGLILYLVISNYR